VDALQIVNVKEKKRLVPNPQRLRNVLLLAQIIIVMVALMFIVLGIKIINCVLMRMTIRNPALQGKNVTNHVLVSATL